MTTFHEESIPCPSCAAEVHAVVVTSTNAMGGESDLMPLTSGMHAVPLLVAACECGYADYAGRFSSTTLTANQRHRLLESDLPHFFAPGRDIPGYRRYELAVRARAILGDGPFDLANLMLRASWCVRIEGEARPESLALEEYYRRGAIGLYRRAIAESELKPEDRATSLYLVAELSRLVGEFASAVRGFDLCLADGGIDEKFLRVVRELRRRAERLDRAVAPFSELAR